MVMTPLWGRPLSLGQGHKLVRVDAIWMRLTQETVVITSIYNS